MGTIKCDVCGEERAEKIRTVEGFGLYRCPGCDFIFVPQAELQAVDYDKLYTPSGEYSGKVDRAAAMQKGQAIPRYERARRKAIGEIRQLRPRRMLEVGCGVGDFLRLFEAEGVECYGTDVSATALELARKHVKGPLHLGDPTPEVFEGVEFDVVCAWEVIEHVADPLVFLGRLFGRVRPGGWVYLSTPNYESPIMWKDMERDPRSRPPVHVTFWNRRSIRRALERVGFTDVGAETHSIPAGPAKRSGGPVYRWAVFAHSYIDPRVRRSLLARARKPE